MNDYRSIMYNYLSSSTTGSEKACWQLADGSGSPTSRFPTAIVLAAVV